MKTKIKPLGDRVMVEAVVESESTKGGIVIPDTAREKPMECKVIAVGTGKRDKEGELIPLDLKAGDRVLVAKYGGTEIKFNGIDYRVVPTDDVLALL